MGITNSNKVIDATRIDCDGTFKVTLALSAAPDIVNNPTDIVLILDRSGSMAGSPLANLKNGAKKFIDIIDEATDGAQDGQIGSGSRIGIVSFADTAVQNTQLITSVADLKAAVDSLSAGGSTNHADAFTKATQLFDPASTNAKVMVMFTDGKTTAGPNPSPVAAAARAPSRKLSPTIIKTKPTSGNAMTAMPKRHKRYSPGKKNSAPISVKTALKILMNLSIPHRSFRITTASSGGAG